MTGSSVLVVGALAAVSAAAAALTVAGLLQSWRGWRLGRRPAPLRLRVSERTLLNDDTVALTLSPAGWRRRLPAFQPGQHVVLRIPAGAAGSVRRAYTLAEWTARPRAYHLAVKREEGGLGSSWLHVAATGVLLESSPPRGSFHIGLAGAAPEVTLIAGGIGITPMRAMLHAWAAQAVPPRVTLIHCARDEDGLHYRAEFEDLAARHGWFRYRPRLTRPGPDWRGEMGRIDAAALAGGGPESVFFLCAGRAMEETALATLRQLGVDPTRIHRESFGVPAVPSGIQADVTAGGRTFAFDGAPTLLHALRREGITLASECGAGQCGACRVDVTVGRTKNLLTGREEAGTALACCSVPVGDVEIAIRG